MKKHMGENIKNLSLVGKKKKIKNKKHKECFREFDKYFQLLNKNVSFMTSCSKYKDHSVENTPFSNKTIEISMNYASSLKFTQKVQIDQIYDLII